MHFIGIDPGLGGGIAVIPADDTGARVYRMPTLKAGVKNRSDYNIHELCDILRAEHDRLKCSPTDIMTVIEKQWAMNKLPGGKECPACKRSPSQGVSAMFTQGAGYGILRAAVVAMRFRMILISPATWKSRMELIGRSKDYSRQMAIQLFPYLASALRFQKDHGPAEALLLAEYGRRCEKR